MTAGDLVQERYRLEAPLGRGGMAEVWRALDERLQRPVAVKFLTSRYTEDPEFLVRFFSEAQAVAGISHGHVVRVLDFGMADVGPFLVLEVVEGGSLSDRIGTPLAIGESFRLVREAAEGAGAAHERGIVHRDLKPGNILLTDSDQVKLADFGIATLGSIDHLALTGTAIGSPNYISPEGAQGKNATPASDVYSLGIVLYELLTGRRPFESGSATAVALAHVEQEPEPPSAHRPELPAWIDALVLTCLAKNPAARYANGDELAAALRAGEAGAPVLPLADTSGDKPRSPRLAIASIASAAVLALGGFLLASADAPVTPSAEAGAGELGPVGPPRPSVSPTEGSSPYDTGAAIVSTESDPSPTPSPSTGEERGTDRNEGDTAAAGEDVTEEEPPADAEEPEPEEEEEPTPQETAPSEEETPVEEEPTPAPEQEEQQEGSAEA